MKCNGCLSLIKDQNYIECSSTGCRKTFCTLCISLTGASKERLTSWKCPHCCASAKKGKDNNSTPVRQVNDSLNVTLRKKTLPSQVDSSPLSEVKELTTELRLLTKEIQDLKQRLEVATDSLSRCHVRLDELGVTVSANESRIIAIEESSKLEVQGIKLTVSSLKTELNNQAQMHLCNEIEIAGIPENSNENVHHVFLLAARKIGVDLDDKDIDWVSRVGPRKPVPPKSAENSTPRPIVARFLRRSKRDHIIRMSKSRRNITSTDIDIPGPRLKVYFNERLTKDNRMLFREARTKSKSHGYAYCWCSQGAIYVRQREGKAAVHISTYEDILQVFGSPPNEVVEETEQGEKQLNV